jgi:hypothetical protein
MLRSAMQALARGGGSRSVSALGAPPCMPLAPGLTQARACRWRQHAARPPRRRGWQVGAAADAAAAASASARARAHAAA